MARVRNIKRKRGKDITGSVEVNSRGYFMRCGRNISAWVSNEREREREVNTIPNDVSTTPSCLSIIASLYDLSISAPARTLVITTGPNLHAKLRITSTRPPLYLVSLSSSTVKTSKRLSTLILDLSFSPFFKTRNLVVVNGGKFRASIGIWLFRGLNFSC